MDLFGIEPVDYKELDQTEHELKLLESVWEMTREWLDKWNGWRTCKFRNLNVKEMEDEATNKFQKRLAKMAPRVKSWKVWRALSGLIQRFQQTMPLITHLRSDAMRRRHWEKLQEDLQQPLNPMAEDFTLDKVFLLGLHMHGDTIKEIASIAARELTIENQLDDIESAWSDMKLDLVRYKGRYWKIHSMEKVNDALETHQLQLTSHKNSIFYPNFSKKINEWVGKLNEIGETLEVLLQVSWSRIQLQLYLSTPGCFPFSLFLFF